MNWGSLMKTMNAMVGALVFSVVTSAHAASPAEAQGLWLTADKDAVIEFASCADRSDALCGRIVWDKDAGTARDTCGVLIAQLDRFDGGAWREGWVYDPRDKKKYKGVVRVKSGDLQIRAFVGVEILGQTEQLTRIASLPTTPTCKP